MAADLQTTRIAVPHAPPSGLVLGPLDADPTSVAEAAAAATMPGHVDYGIWLGVDRGVYWSQLLEGDGPCGPVLAAASRVVLDADGAIAGVVVVTEMPATAWWAGDPWIPEIFVVSSFQGRGLGGLLLEHAVGSCARAGNARLGLTVSEGNPARRLYERFGFRSFRSTWLIDLASGVW
jgi:GNAT superfamily N-acetyltransferase